VKKNQEETKKKLKLQTEGFFCVSLFSVDKKTLLLFLKMFFYTLGCIAFFLLIAVLGLILFNSVQRCYTQYKHGDMEERGHEHKYVDFYAAEKDKIPMKEIGSTVLVDLGMQNTDTGVYLIQKEEAVKINIPEPREKYHIRRGEFAGHVHLIRENIANELERLHTQIISKSGSVLEHVTDVCMDPNLTESISIYVPSSQKTPFIRKLNVVNLSAHECLLILQECHEEWVKIQPKYIGFCFIVKTQACRKAYFFPPLV